MFGAKYPNLVLEVAYSAAEEIAVKKAEEYQKDLEEFSCHDTINHEAKRDVSFTKYMSLEHEASSTISLIEILPESENS